MLAAVLAAGALASPPPAFAVSVGRDIKVREAPSMSAAEITRLGADLALLAVTGQSDSTQTVRVRGRPLEHPWLEITLPDGRTGHAWAGFFHGFADRGAAEAFISVNRSFRTHTSGVFCLARTPDEADPCGDDVTAQQVWERTALRLSPDGALRIVIAARAGGDTISTERGSGRYVVFGDTLILDARVDLEVVFDGDPELGRELMGCNPCERGSRPVTHRVPLSEADRYLVPTAWQPPHLAARTSGPQLSSGSQSSSGFQPSSGPESSSRSSEEPTSRDTEPAP